MGQDQHLDRRNEVEEEPQAGQMNAYLAPAHQAMEHGWEDGDTSRRIENSRNPEPEQNHDVFTLKALLNSIL
jgi:hypothetical protein